jgi:hypothetical protein
MASERNMNPPELNTIYIYKSPQDFKKLSVRAYERYKYMVSGIIRTGEINRYALTVGSVTALMVSTETDTKKVTNFIKKLKLDQSYTGKYPLKTEYKYV